MTKVIPRTEREAHYPLRLCLNSHVPTPPTLSLPKRPGNPVTRQLGNPTTDNASS